MSTPGEYIDADDRQATLHSMRTLAAYVALWRQALGEAGVHGQVQDDLTVSWFQHTMTQSAADSAAGLLSKSLGDIRDMLDGIGDSGDD